MIQVSNRIKGLRIAVLPLRAWRVQMVDLIKNFTSYSEWKTACQVAGLEGPYQISGQPHMWQYVHPIRRGTAALWNHKGSAGFVEAQA